MKNIKTLLIAVVLLLLFAGSVQGIGVNVSAFLPRNGSLSHPVSPLSFRDVGFTVGKYFGIAGELSLNNINGMGFVDPGGRSLQMSSPAGPFYAARASLMLKAVIPVWRLSFQPGGGLFGYYLLNPRLKSGVIDSYIAKKSNYETVDSNFAIMNKFGWGYVFGGMVALAFDGKFGMQAGAYYYTGSSPLELDGTYHADGSSVANPVPSYLSDTRLDFTGIEFVIGGTYEL